MRSKNQIMSGVSVWVALGILSFAHAADFADISYRIREGNLVTVTSPLTESGQPVNFHKIGPGTLAWGPSVINGYTGDTTVEGTLVLSAPSNIPNIVNGVGQFILGDQAALKIALGATSSFLINQMLSVPSGVATFSLGDKTVSLAYGVTGGGYLNVTTSTTTTPGSATIQLSNSTNAGFYVGEGVTVQAKDGNAFGPSGSMVYLQGGTISSAVNTTLSVAANLVLSASSYCNPVNPADQLTFSAVNPSGQNMTISGSGTCLFSTLATGGTTFQNVNVKSGTFSIIDPKLSPTGGVYVQDGGIIELSSGTYNFPVTSVPAQ